MKLGFFIQPVHPPSRRYADVLREDREAVVLADRLGYNEAFIGEHLMDSAETITSCLAFIASLADACPSITFGTGVLPLANYHPAMAAAQIAMVDHLVNGRLVLGIGPGVPGDAEAIGDTASDRNRKTQEALEHICRIWSEEAPYRIEGEFYRTTTERALDPSIGHAILCGSGGTLTEIARDSVCRLQPLTDLDAEAMLNEMRSIPLLRGFRGAPPADEGALRDVLLRISAMVDACPEIAEMDINPVMVLPKGVVAVDVRMRVARPAGRPPARRVAY